MKEQRAKRANALLEVTCKSCGAEILWVVTKSGTRMPLDAAPNPAGNLVISDDDPPVVMSACESWGAERGPYISHFATCPQAASHRRRS